MGKFIVNMMNLQAFVLIVFTSFFTACSSNTNDSSKDQHNRIENRYYDGKGIGPVQELTLDPQINSVLVESGEKMFNAKCSSCHKLTSQKAIGPGLSAITERRRPEWIMNMILNPMEMTQKDSLAKELLAIYYSQMLDNELSQEEARSILEFLRTK